MNSSRKLPLELGMGRRAPLCNSGGISFNPLGSLRGWYSYPRATDEEAELQRDKPLAQGHTPACGRARLSASPHTAAGNRDLSTAACRESHTSRLPSYTPGWSTPDLRKLGPAVPPTALISYIFSAV